MQKKIISLFISNPKFFIYLISTQYSFTCKELEKYQDILNWILISQNENINWTREIFETFEERLKWDLLSANPSAFKDLTLLKTFENHIHWKPEIPDLIGGSICFNEGLPWTIEFIESIKHKIDFYELSMNKSVPWSEALIDKYVNSWDFSELGANDGVPWDLRLFEKYLDVSHLESFLVQNHLKLNSDINFIEKYKDNVSWFAVCSNPDLPWKELNLLERWKKDLCWGGLGNNEKLFGIYDNFFKNNLTNWATDPRSFRCISGNKGMYWSSEIINGYADLWDWNYLCANEAVAWNSNLIEFFADRIIWGGELPCELTDEDGNFISETGGYCCVPGLVDNIGVQWSVELIDRYKSEIEFIALSQNKGAWKKAFKPYFDAELINLVARII
jgi:hypothetical protein